MFCLPLEGGGRCVRGLARHRRPIRTRNDRAKPLDASGGGDRVAPATDTPTWARRMSWRRASNVGDRMEQGRVANSWRAFLPPHVPSAQGEAKKLIPVARG